MNSLRTSQARTCKYGFILVWIMILGTYLQYVRSSLGENPDSPFSMRFSSPAAVQTERMTEHSYKATTSTYSFGQSVSALEHRRSWYKSDDALHIVVAFYGQKKLTTLYKMAQKLWSFPNVAQTNPRWILYVKSNDTTKEEIAEAQPMDLIVHLPNYGREGHSYLWHIVENYDWLAEHSLFCQEDPHGINSAWLHNFTPKTGFMALSDVQICGCEGFMKPDAASYMRVREIWLMFHKTFCPGEYVCALKGCFIVSRRRIQANPWAHYKFLLDTLEVPDEHFMHKQPLGVRKPNWMFSHTKDFSTRDTPMFGYSVEAAWSVIFNCTGKESFNRGAGLHCLDG